MGLSWYSYISDLLKKGCEDFMKLEDFFNISDLETIRDSLNDYYMSLKVGFFPQDMDTTMFIGEEMRKCQEVIKKIDKLLQDKEMKCVGKN